MECTSCGLKWGIPTKHYKNIFDLYDESYFNSEQPKSLGYSKYCDERKLRNRTFESWFKEIELFHGPGTCLDIGCAFGFSIEVAQERNWTVDGLDVSDYACKIASEICRGEIICEDFLSFKSNKDYDLVTAWDVIEHTQSPALFIKNVRNCLKTGGLVALTTPNCSSPVARLLGQNWFEYKWPEHTYYLNSNTLRLYLEMFGFRICSLKTAIKYKTLEDAIARWAGFYECRNFHLGKLGKKTVPYSSLSEVFLIAQKV